MRVSWIEWEYIGYLEEKFEFGLLQEKGKKKLKQKREKKEKMILKIQKLLPFILITAVLNRAITIKMNIESNCKSGDSGRDRSGGELKKKHNLPHTFSFNNDFWTRSMIDMMYIINV